MLRANSRKFYAVTYCGNDAPAGRGCERREAGLLPRTAEPLQYLVGLCIE
jgi:hypothetical protein